ncbi:MAG: CTP synthase, partial [Nitrospinae bacterium]|nr:CTP synthase [Nitrospinota bacterium]
NVCYVHVTLVPYIKTAHELKTKPTQHSVRALLELGVQPDILVCRSEEPLDDDVKRKIALFANMPPSRVVSAVDVQSIYEVPLRFAEERLDLSATAALHLDPRESDLKPWQDLVELIYRPKPKVNIAIIGKYMKISTESYKSLAEALTHGGLANGVDVELMWVDAEALTDENVERTLREAHGILVPGGFGERGLEGKLRAIRTAREKKIPFFGICLGMQTAVIEFARNVLNLKGANSMEFDETCPHPVIHFMADQSASVVKGGTMRLGAYPCYLKAETKSHRAYGAREIDERHRHRLEFNNKYRLQMEDAGMIFAGQSPDGRLVEIVELPDHPWFVGCQFHPEFKSTPMKSHPLFREFIAAAVADENLI